MHIETGTDDARTASCDHLEVDVACSIIKSFREVQVSVFDVDTKILTRFGKDCHVRPIFAKGKLLYSGFRTQLVLSEKIKTQASNDGLPRLRLIRRLCLVPLAE